MKNLVKKYADFKALDGLSFEVNKNEIFGLLGPNGAGKTTLIHILATLLKPTEGGAVVNGFDVLHNATKVRQSIGVVFQAPSSDDILTGYENLKVHALLYGIPRKIREKRISEVLHLVGLEDRKDDQVKKYSGGMRRRLEIARGLLHQPKVFFLDEPTLGLDPKSRESMWKYIKKIVREEKVTIILTTHYMEEADMLCDRIGFITNGKIIALDAPSKLKQEIGGDIVKITFSGAVPVNKDFTKLDFVHKVEQNDNSVIIYMEEVNSNLHMLTKDLDNVQTIEYKKPTLNDVFLKLSGDSLSGDSPEGGFMQRYAQYDKS
ncbi:MAG TPA: ATP-binding cassette domain-containing protein [Nitrososphaeraceae archaeon]|nr:ATP-binding cassette domain-containing protein [Nitrososphaeraceae archaeon]